jgi:hypothetical protein
MTCFTQGARQLDGPASTDVWVGSDVLDEEAAGRAQNPWVAARTTQKKE